MKVYGVFSPGSWQIWKAINELHCFWCNCFCLTNNCWIDSFEGKEKQTAKQIKKELKVLVLFIWPLIAWLCFLCWHLTLCAFLCILSGCPFHEWSIYLYHSDCRKDHLESQNTFFTVKLLYYFLLHSVFCKKWSKKYQHAVFEKTESLRKITGIFRTLLFTVCCSAPVL